MEDIWLDPPEDHSAALTRKVLRTRIIDNAHSNVERVQACIIHQRRHPKSPVWQDVNTFNMATIKAGQEVKLNLSCAETFQLHETLSHLLKISESGVPKGERVFDLVDRTNTLVVRGSERRTIERLLNQAGDEVWKALEELEPHLFKATMLTKLHQVREQAVHDFNKHLKDKDWAEPAWQKFFEDNTWIFGYGLTYRFLSIVQSQPNYGGAGMSGGGGQRGDFLVASEAEKRFTVLVEIKKPETTLLTPERYRNGVYAASPELAGAIAQIQKNCFTWDDEGSHRKADVESLAERGISNVRPKSLLIVGHTSQLDNSDKRECFTLLRNNLHSPEIITFDELAERARHLLLTESKQFNRGNKVEDDCPY